jgi:hypothetical protein
MLEWKGKSPDLLKNQHVEVEVDGVCVLKQRIRHRIELELRSFGRKGWHIYGHGEQEEKRSETQDYASTIGAPCSRWRRGSQGNAWSISGIETLTGDMRFGEWRPDWVKVVGGPGCLQGSKWLTQAV